MTDCGSLPIGIYIHIPFCDSKCPYCDFYSVRINEEMMDAYTERVLKELVTWSRRLGRTADSLYLGGGTPSVLGGERLSRIIETARRLFQIGDAAEVTVECNPHRELSDTLKALACAGANRISLGLQSAVDAERRHLGRNATVADAERSLYAAQSAGINNISLDVMLGIPLQTFDSLDTTLDFCISSGATHISAYILKLEPGTVFYKRQKELLLPDEDSVCDFYLHTCERLCENGFGQYEISNFSREGFRGQHNLKYWNDMEYLGIGPCAHSFIGGNRFYYPRSVEQYIKEPVLTEDGSGGDVEEYIMLRLRLCDGLTEQDFFDRFGYSIPTKYYNNAKKYLQSGLVQTCDGCIRLTYKGFLLSNSLIGGIINGY